MHFDTTRQIDIELGKLDEVIKHANDAGLHIAIYSNTRSTFGTTCSPKVKGEHSKYIY